MVGANQGAEDRCEPNRSAVVIGRVGLQVLVAACQRVPTIKGRAPTQW